MSSIDEPKEVTELRKSLLAWNGIPQLEMCEPHEIEKATRIFHRDGFVVIKNALSPSHLQSLKKGVEREVQNILQLDPKRRGNRGVNRYSFGGSSKTAHLLHIKEWVDLIDVPTITPILISIFDGNDNYHVRGGGGDFCMPGAYEYQPLHQDMGNLSFNDKTNKLTFRDLPHPYVCVNYLVQDFTKVNGPTRQIPGTHHSNQPIPSFKEEPEWMKRSTLCGAHAGSAVIRDVRCWHGGTPNLSNECRAIPNCEYFAPYYSEPFQPSLPYNIYKTMTPFQKKICRRTVIFPDEELNVNFGYDEKLRWERYYYGINSDKRNAETHPATKLIKDIKKKNKLKKSEKEMRKRVDSEELRKKRAKI